MRRSSSENLRAGSGVHTSASSAEKGLPRSRGGGAQEGMGRGRKTNSTLGSRDTQGPRQGFQVREAEAAGKPDSLVAETKATGGCQEKQHGEGKATVRGPHSHSTVLPEAGLPRLLRHDMEEKLQSLRADKFEQCLRRKQRASQQLKGE